MGNPDCNNTVLFRTLNPLHSNQPQIIKACWPKLLDRPHPGRIKSMQPAESKTLSQQAPALAKPNAAELPQYAFDTDQRRGV